MVMTNSLNCNCGTFWNCTAIQVKSLVDFPNGRDDNNSKLKFFPIFQAYQ